jgi:hypothetical protein
MTECGITSDLHTNLYGKGQHAENIGDTRIDPV